MAHQESRTKASGLLGKLQIDGQDVCWEVGTNPKIWRPPLQTGTGWQASGARAPTPQEGSDPHRRGSEQRKRLTKGGLDL